MRNENKEEILKLVNNMLGQYKPRKTIEVKGQHIPVATHIDNLMDLWFADNEPMLVAENKELKEEIRKLKGNLFRTNLENQKLNNELLGQALPMIDREIQKAVIDFKKYNFEKIESLRESLGEMKKLTKTMQQIIKNNLNEAEVAFRHEIYDRDLKIESMFNEALEIFIKKLSFDGSSDKYVQRRLLQVLKSYKSDKLDILIKELYTRIIKKFNVKISKEIVKEIADMSLIQQQTLEKCTQIIAMKEHRYLCELENKSKPLLLGEY